MTDEQIQAAKEYIRLVKMALKHDPFMRVADVFACGCRGPQPECHCAKRDRLVKEFLESET